MVNHYNQRTESPVDSDIFSSYETAWSKPIQCNFGCGHHVTFNKEIVGQNGDQIPHLSSTIQHFCPIGYRNFHNLDAFTKAQNRIIAKTDLNEDDLK